MGFSKGFILQSDVSLDAIPGIQVAAILFLNYYEFSYWKWYYISAID